MGERGGTCFGSGRSGWVSKGIGVETGTITQSLVAARSLEQEHLWVLGGLKE